MTNKIKRNEKSGGVSPMVAAMTGAVLGAGAVVAGAVVLSDEKNSKKVKEAFKKAKHQATNYMDDLQKRILDSETEGEKKVAESKEKIEAATKPVKKSLHTLVDDAKKALEK